MDETTTVILMLIGAFALGWMLAKEWYIKMITWNGWKTKENIIQYWNYVGIVDMEWLEVKQVSKLKGEWKCVI